MAGCRLCNPRPMESIDPITVEALIPRCHYNSCTQELSEGFVFFAAEFGPDSADEQTGSFTRFQVSQDP